MVLHGTYMSTEHYFANIFGSYAAENDIILLLPQAKAGWDYEGTYDFETQTPFGMGKDADMDLQYTQKGRLMKFLRELVRTATEAKTATFTDDLAGGEYEFMEAYPTDFYDSKEGDEDEDDDDDGAKSLAIYSSLMAIVSLSMVM